MGLTSIGMLVWGRWLIRRVGCSVLSRYRGSGGVSLVGGMDEIVGSAGAGGGGSMRQLWRRVSPLSGKATADGEAGDTRTGFLRRRGSCASRLARRADGFLKRRRLGVDTVLVCCHGGPGEDGTLQGALEPGWGSLFGTRRGGSQQLSERG